jgi:hypothetical protein
LFAIDGTEGDLPGPNNTYWYNLFKVLKKPWFERAWIVQELAVSPQVLVVCGERSFSWDDLVAAFKYLVECEIFSLQFGVLGLQALLELDLHRSRFQAGNKADAIQVLLQNRRAHATDPRDKIFAFHGFFEVGNFGHEITSPRYEKSCVEVYTDVAIEFIRRYHNLDILSSISRVHPKSPGLETLPTWVPDWSSSDPTESFLWRKLIPDFPAEAVATYRASGDSTYNLEPGSLNHAGGTKLRIEGWVIDEVKKISLAMENQPDHIPIYDYWNLATGIVHGQRVQWSWECVVYDPFTMHFPYPTGESWDSAYRSTLLGGWPIANTPSIFRLFEVNKIRSLHIRLLQILRLHRVWLVVLFLYLLTPISWVLERWKHIPWVKSLLQDYPSGAAFQIGILASLVGNRVVIKTAEGLIGLAPASYLDVRAGLIVLCKGAKMPIIIRPVGELGNCIWEVVGDCYVHGLIDGRLWDMLEGNGKYEREGRIWDIYRKALEIEASTAAGVKEVFWLS